jgi:hypothetical protein
MLPPSGGPVLGLPQRIWLLAALAFACSNSRVSETHTQPKSSCLPSHRRTATNTVRSLRFTIDMFGPVQVVVAVGDSSPANNRLQRFPLPLPLPLPHATFDGYTTHANRSTDDSTRHPTLPFPLASFSLPLILSCISHPL